MTFITENNIANLYSAIIEMPIFDEYKLPPASKVDFVIVDDSSICGEYQPPEQGEPHVITISVARHSHLYPVLITLCHEIWLYIQFHQKQSSTQVIKACFLNYKNV